jgi:predicted phosphate transport protein (TIGR00153 family)
MNINAIFQFLVPKESKFFPLFIKVAENLLEGTKVFKELTLEKNPENYNNHIKIIKEIEQKGDILTHDIFTQLNSTFITPFDRQDIQELTSSMDNVLDYINSTCQRIKVYKPKSLPIELPKNADIIIESAELIYFSINNLKSYKNYEKIKDACIKINSLENEADDLYHIAASALFDNEKDPIELIKIKEILQTIEKVTDAAEDVSDVLKTIIIKQA